MPESPDHAPWPSSHSRRGPLASSYSQRMLPVVAAADAVRDAIARHPWWTDSLLALFLTFISLGSVIFAGNSHDPREIAVLDAVLLPITSLPIAARRYRPLTVLVITVS